MDIQQAMIRAHLLEVVLLTEILLWALDIRVFQNILPHGLSTRNVAKQEEVAIFLLLRRDKEQGVGSFRVLSTTAMCLQSFVFVSSGFHALSQYYVHN